MPEADRRLVGEHHRRLREQVARPQLQQLLREHRAHVVAGGIGSAAVVVIVVVLAVIVICDRGRSQPRATSWASAASTDSRVTRT